MILVQMNRLRAVFGRSLIAGSGRPSCSICALFEGVALPSPAAVLMRQRGASVPGA